MKRCVFTIIVFLLLGAIVNVAVAWGLVHFATQFQADPLHSWTDDFAHFSPIQEGDRSLLAVLGWKDLPNASLHLDVMTALGVSLRVVTENTGSYNITAYEETRAGWPALGLRGVRYNTSNPSARQRGQSTWAFRAAISRPDAMGLFNKQLPLRPNWPGFAINTVFYAVILWALFAAPFGLGGIGRRRRIKRGLCPKCAYDLRGAGSDSKTCPECGTALAVQPRRGDGV